MDMRNGNNNCTGSRIRKEFSKFMNKIEGFEKYPRQEYVQRMEISSTMSIMWIHVKKYMIWLMKNILLVVYAVIK